ncbi:MAG: energy-coupling factor transporter transmembrane component T, partial [Ignisphaera sp.]
IALRFLSVVADDLIEILSIQKTRGLFLKGAFFDRVRSYLAIFIPLIISTLNRIDEVTISLEVKGFGFSKKRTYICLESFRSKDVVFICLCLIWLILAIYFGI